MKVPLYDRSASWYNYTPGTSNTPPEKTVTPPIRKSQESGAARGANLLQKPSRPYWTKERLNILMTALEPTIPDSPERAAALMEVKVKTGFKEEVCLKKFLDIIRKTEWSKEDQRIGKYKSDLYEDTFIAQLMGISSDYVAEKWERITRIELHLPTDTNTWTFSDLRRFNLFIRNLKREYITLDDFQELTQTIKSVTPKMVLVKIESLAPPKPALDPRISY